MAQLYFYLNQLKVNACLTTEVRHRTLQFMGMRLVAAFSRAERLRASLFIENKNKKHGDIKNCNIIVARWSFFLLLFLIYYGFPFIRKTFTGNT